MRKIYFIIFGLLLGMSYDFTYSMETNPLFHSAESFSSVSSGSREMSFNIRRSHSRSTLLNQEGKFIREASPNPNQIASFDRKKLTPKSPFSIGLGYSDDCVEETKSYILDQVQYNPIVIPAKGGIIIVTSKNLKLIEDEKHLQYLYGALSNINTSIETNDTGNLSSDSQQLRVIYKDQDPLIVYSPQSNLEQKLDLKRGEGYTQLFINFFTYNDYKRYYEALSECIQKSPKRPISLAAN